MQILIELDAPTRGITPTDKHQRILFQKEQLLRLLARLEENAFHINNLFGNVIFDEAKKEVIDVGEAGGNAPAIRGFVDALFQAGAKLAVIFVEERHIMFLDSFFVAIHFSHMRKVRPLSCFDVNESFVPLVIGKDATLLDKLYFDKFEEIYGQGADPVSYFPNDNTLRTSGYGLPFPKKK